MQPARGFSFIEVTVSLFIIGIVILLGTTILKSAPLTRHTAYQDTAVKIATNEIEILRAAGYDAIPTSGIFSDTLLTTLPSGTAALAVSTFNTNTKTVTATVSWIEKDGAAYSVPITSLITKVGGLK